MNKKRALELMKIEQKCVKRQQCDRDCGKCDLVQEQAELIEAFNMAIDSLKRDAVKHGRWIYRGRSAGGRIYQCSCCQSLICGTGNYCKECGSKMDEEAES